MLNKTYDLDKKGNLHVSTQKILFVNNGLREQMSILILSNTQIFTTIIIFFTLNSTSH